MCLGAEGFFFVSSLAFFTSCKLPGGITAAGQWWRRCGQGSARSLIGVAQDQGVLAILGLAWYLLGWKNKTKSKGSGQLNKSASQRLKPILFRLSTREHKILAIVRVSIRLLST